MYQVRLNDSSNNLCVTCTYVISESFQNISAAVLIIDRTRRSKQEPADLYSLIWQPRFALLSYFSGPDNERANLRSQHLVVVFPAKANLRVLAIFKQRTPISGWFCNSTVSSFFGCKRMK